MAHRELLLLCCYARSEHIVAHRVRRHIPAWLYVCATVSFSLSYLVLRYGTVLYGLLALNALAGSYPPYGRGVLLVYGVFEEGEFSKQL